MNFSALRRTVVPTLMLGLLPLSFCTAASAVQTPTAITPKSYTGNAVTENFDGTSGLAQTGTSSTLPQGVGFVETGNSANAFYTANAGAGTAGDSYSYGSTSKPADRALGSLRSSNLVPQFGIIIKNDTSTTLTSFTVTYTGEQYRNGSSSTDRLDFQYLVGAAGNTLRLDTGTYIDVDEGDFVGPQSTSSSTDPFDGNLDANKKTISVTVTNVSIAPNASVAIRFADFDTAGAEDGLAVDDFSFSVGDGTPTPTTPPTPTATPTPTAAPTPLPTLPDGTSPSAIISEFRVSGPGGSTDDFIEIYNTTASTLDVSGWTVRTDNTVPGKIVGTIPSNTSIPRRGHLLFTGSSYSLKDYGGTNAALGDVSLSADLPSDSGVALCNASGVIVDQAGVVGSLFVEGSALPKSTSTLQYSYVRHAEGGLPQDSNDNQTDFILVAPDNTAGSGVQRLGVAGPENLSSPIQSNATIAYGSADPSSGSAVSPNSVRDTTPGTNATYGTIALRRRLTNNTGLYVTKLRLRLIEITAGTPSATGVADARVLSSSPAASLVINGLPVRGLSADAPSQSSNGILNSSFSVPLPAAGLAPGESINVEIVLGAVQKGSYKISTNVEALTSTTAPPLYSDNDNMLLGNPSSAVEGAITESAVNENNRLVRRTEYALGYNRSLGGSKWVSWHLDSADTTDRSTRRDPFRVDPLLPTQSQIQDGDYSGSGYSRGHQCSSSDRLSSQTANDNTFYMSNMLPQYQTLNGGSWLKLEDYCQSAVSGGANEVYIMSGGIYENTTTIASGKIRVPSHCWKVAVILPTGTNDISRITANTRVAAVIMPNVNNSSVTVAWDSASAKFVTTVDEIEARTGLDLLSNLPDAVEAALESKVGDGK